MSKLIIKNSITQLKLGYPTVSDKYNVAGGVVDQGVGNILFGDLVAYTEAAGYYKPLTTIADIAELAGVCLATNVKLLGTWPDDGTQTPANKPGEAFNLMLDGYVALAIDADATANEIAPGKKVAILKATGKLTTADNAAGDTPTAIIWPGAVFTGIKDGNLVEVDIRRV